MSLKKILEEYVQNRNIIEEHYKDMILQYNTKYNELNIYAPEGIDKDEFVELKKKAKEKYPGVSVNVNEKLL